MSASKFRFVSPGIQLREIDRSQIPEEPEIIGPVVIGRARRGPALRPVKVDSYSEFVEIFGEPSPGGKTGDVWREGGETLSPIYGAYAAQAWLRNGSPLTYVRLQGRAHTDSTTGGEAGWKIGNGTIDAVDANNCGGAYGLFLIDSGTVHGIRNAATGTLAAVWYCATGSDTNGGGAIFLSGTNGAGTAQAGTAGMFTNARSGPTFGAIIENGAGTALNTVQFNFDPNSGNFIRKVFNTNPTLLNSRTFASGSFEGYFLGETFERDVQEKILNSNTNSVWGVILGLHNTTTAWATQQDDCQPAQTSWIVGQDLGNAASWVPSNSKQLFQVLALDTGDWTQGNLKISITDIRYSNEPSEKWGSFSLLVRKAQDNDSSMKVVESFTGLNLNPNSPNYIGQQIGDRYAQWDDTKRRYREFGRFANKSRYIRIKVASAIDAGGASNESYLPFGYLGPLRFSGFRILSGASDACTFFATDISSTTSTAMAQGNGDIPASVTTASQFVDFGKYTKADAFTGSFQFPRSYLRQNTLVGNLSDPTDAFFGVDTTKSGSSLRFDDCYIDVNRGLPGSQYRNVDTFSTVDPTAGTTEYSYVFSLDDVSYHTSSASTTTSTAQSIEAYYLSGSRNSLTSLSATGSNSYKNTLDAGFDQFTVPMFGGFNGTDVIETEAFNNSTTTTSGKTQYTSYAYNSIKLGMDSCADPELVEFNLASMPGLTVPGLTNHLIDLCQRRADALGIIDIEGGFVPGPDRSAPGNDYSATNRGNVEGSAGAVQKVKDRQLNNSYATCYYPWLTVRDGATGLNFFAPPSIAALGTYAYSESRSELWFAPAGFTRGGLSEGAGGISIIGVTEKLTSKQRDKLYEVNINPIASFPAEGLVVFGQKTLQGTRSALDRVNVRRLLIYVKKEISRIAARLLFDPNLQTTWDRFKGQSVPFLESVKQRMGLMDYKVVLDETTTTPDLIDRNIMYAKIFLKPARAIEFIALDFVITNSGASFDD